MGSHKPADKLIVQKVFEMIAAGNSPRQIGLFFTRSRGWVRNILEHYSWESFSPIVLKKRGPERRTTKEEDQLIIQKGRETFCAPVRAILAKLNSPIKKKISYRTAARRFREAGARTVRTVKDQLMETHK